MTAFHSCPLKPDLRYLLLQQRIVITEITEKNWLLVVELKSRLWPKNICWKTEQNNSKLGVWGEWKGRGRIWLLMSCSLASYPHIPPGLSGIPDWLEGLSSEFRKQIEARGRDVCVLGPSSQDLSRNPRPGCLDSWRSLLPQVSLLPQLRPVIHGRGGTRRGLSFYSSTYRLI